jgi:hypothetical protein
MQVLLLNGRKKKDIIDNNSLSLSSESSRKGEGFHFEKCYMYLNIYKMSFTKMMRNLFIGTRSISFYYLF